MKHLFDLKRKIEDLYYKSPNVIGYAARFILSEIAVLVLRSNMDYNELFSNIFFCLVFAAVCALFPTRYMLLAYAAYIVVQIVSLSAGLAILTGVLLAIMYLICIRFDEEADYVIFLIPLMCMLRLPLLIPLILAVTAGFGTVVSTLLGFLTYYFLHYIHINTAVFQGIADGTEITKMSMLISGLFSYKELWYTLFCVAVAFIAAYFLKKISINQSNSMAIAIGSGIFLVLLLICNLVYGTLTYNRLSWNVFGTVVSCLLALIISSVLLPLDYHRTEFLEFEDNEYKYFVRAVPKSNISRESVRIKRIYSRKKKEQPIRREEDT